MIQKLQSSYTLAESQKGLMYQAFREGFIDGESVAMDATLIKARDRKPDNMMEERGFS